jgi:hypothetical protein
MTYRFWTPREAGLIRRVDRGNRGEVTLRRADLDAPGDE